MRALYGEYLSRVNSQSEAVTAVHGSLAGLERGRWLLAVSGGRDSMVLLDALASARAPEIAAVATFDHGTGPAARRAAQLVEREALARELRVVSGSMGAASPARRGSEAQWRAERWRFLRGWAAELRATIVTAHTRDDQIETVAMRILRGSGARGLAGMLAPMSGIVRPLLEVTRAQVQAYVDARGVAFVEDPSNASRAHLRNRVRLDLLPALERAAPGFREWCWNLGVRAAAWRAELQGLAWEQLAPALTGVGTVVVNAQPPTALGPGEWAVLWPELAGQVGVAMDRRGVERAAAWAPQAKPGAVIPLAGGAEIERTAETFVLRAVARHSHSGAPNIYIADDNEQPDRL